MSNLVNHSIKELAAIGFPTPSQSERDRMLLEIEWFKNTPEILSDETYNYMISQSVLKLIHEFATQNHSGLSASITLDIFEKLANFKPLTELTDSPGEWEDHTTTSGTRLYQNKRNSRAFTSDPSFKRYYDMDDIRNSSYLWCFSFIPWALRRRMSPYFTYKKSKTIKADK